MIGAFLDVQDLIGKWEGPLLRKLNPVPFRALQIAPTDMDAIHRQGFF